MITRYRAQIKEKNDLRKGGKGHTRNGGDGKGYGERGGRGGGVMESLAR